MYISRSLVEIKKVCWSTPLKYAIVIKTGRPNATGSSGISAGSAVLWPNDYPEQSERFVAVVNQANYGSTAVILSLY